MSDKTNKPTDKDEKKSDFVIPKSQQLSATQHVMIWSLVLVVGVLFGMGSTVPMLGETGSRDVGSVSEVEILMRQHVARRLQDILNPTRDQRGEYFEPMDNRNQGLHQMWADRIKLARFAEKQGLMPSGAALDDIVKEFLNRPLLSNPQKHYVDALTSGKCVRFRRLPARRPRADARW
jgi:hypothetical protein